MVVVDGQYKAWRNVLFCDAQGSVLGSLFFILYKHDMLWSENMPVIYAYNSTLLAAVLSSDMRSVI